MAAGAASLMACSSNARAAPFAVACTGTAKFFDKLAGKPNERTYKIPKQVYVFDEQEKRVQRALEPRREFEDVCVRGGYVNEIMFSPGLITVRTEQRDYMCDFKVSRVTGEAQFFTHQDVRGGYHEIDWKMTCERAEIPVFDRSKNKF
jgi:hypothetical protein